MPFLPSFCIAFSLSSLDEPPMVAARRRPLAPARHTAVASHRRRLRRLSCGGASLARSLLLQKGLERLSGLWARGDEREAVLCGRPLP